MPAICLFSLKFSPLLGYLFFWEKLSEHLYNVEKLPLKEIKIHYNRSDTYSKPKVGPGNGRLYVSLIVSEEAFTTHLTRPADFVIALDETFKAESRPIIALRKSRTDLGRLTPVTRLIVLGTVEGASGVEFFCVRFCILLGPGVTYIK